MVAAGIPYHAAGFIAVDAAATSYRDYFCLDTMGVDFHPGTYCRLDHTASFLKENAQFHS